MSRRLADADIRRMSELVDGMSRGGYWEREPVIRSAKGGIGVALCGLVGRSLGVPVADVFGGSVGSEIPFYDVSGLVTGLTRASHPDSQTRAIWPGQVPCFDVDCGFPGR